MYDVFVSYSSKDRVVADAMVHVLEEQGVRCWIAPRNILPGSDYADAIDSAIKEVKVVIFVHSKDSLESKWCKGEVNLAVSNEKIIVPFKIDGALASGGWNLYLANSHWIDAVPEPKKKFGEIARSVLSLIGRESPVPTKDVGNTEDAEAVFLGRVRRFKNNDGVIDSDELERLISLAGRLGIDPARREALIARVEDEFEDTHPNASAHKKEASPARSKEEATGVGHGHTGDEGVSTDDFSNLVVSTFASIDNCGELYVQGDVQGSIPDRKLDGARSIMAPWNRNEPILVVCDTTVFGSASEGLVATKDAVYFKNFMEHSRRLAWSEVSGVSVQGDDILISGQKFNAGTIDAQYRVKIAEAIKRITVNAPQDGDFDIETASAVIAKECGQIEGCSDLYVGGAIVESKVCAAIVSMKVREPRQEVGMQIDTTVFGGAKEGMLLTGKAIYFKNVTEDPVRIEWRKIDKISVSKCDIVINNDLKFETTSSLTKEQARKLRDVLKELTEYFSK